MLVIEPLLPGLPCSEHFRFFRHNFKHLLSPTGSSTNKLSHYCNHWLTNDSEWSILINPETQLVEEIRITTWTCLKHSVTFGINYQAQLVYQDFWTINSIFTMSSFLPWWWFWVCCWEAFQGGLLWDFGHWPCWWARSPAVGHGIGTFSDTGLWKRSWGGEGLECWRVGFWVDFFYLNRWELSNHLSFAMRIFHDVFFFLFFLRINWSTVRLQCILRFLPWHR